MCRKRCKKFNCAHDRRKVDDTCSGDLKEHRTTTYCIMLFNIFKREDQTYCVSFYLEASVEINTNNRIYFINFTLAVPYFSVNKFLNISDQIRYNTYDLQIYYLKKEKKISLIYC